MTRKSAANKKRRPTTVGSGRLVRHAVAARVNSMMSEMFFLKVLYYRMRGELETVESRIRNLESGIAAEKASVPNDPDQRRVEKPKTP